VGSTTYLGNTLASGGTNAAKLLLAGGVTVAKTIYLQQPVVSATQQLVLGGLSGTSAFSGSIVALRDVTLEAAAGADVSFSGGWSDASLIAAPTVNIALGSPGNTGTVRLQNDLRTSGTVSMLAGTAIISADQSYSGRTTISGGRLVTAATQALGIVSTPLSLSMYE
jgi:autotransporter-associated beta strand protein